MTEPPIRKKTALVSRAWNLVWFAVRFFYALLASNLQMARVVLFRPVRELSPDFVEYPVAGLSRLEIVLLSHCITLTPGTTSVEVSADHRVLVVHALDGADHAAVCRSIREDLEEPLLAWTR